ncbi:MAG: DUF1127 domain-containing protein [Rhodobacteraceae bacterium]|nr:DUF1127 domain-containing protein [Paracoccaceae bacterium]
MTIFTAARISAPTHRAARTRLAHLFAVWSQRQTLRKLDDAELSDIGLSRADADVESRRGFWDAPESWRC